MVKYFYTVYYLSIISNIDVSRNEQKNCADKYL